MKTYFSQKAVGSVLIGLFSATMALHAQQRAGGGGGFGGFGGGGFGGGFGRGGFGGGGFGGGAGASTSQYNNNGQVGSAQAIQVDPDTHTVTFVADEQTAAQMQQVLASLDKPKRQVLIKCVFLQVQHNNTLDLGLEGGWTGPVGNNTVSAASAFGLSELSGTPTTTYNALGQANPVPTPTSSSSVGGGFAQLIGKDYQVTLQAIAQSGKAEILSRPSILARDGQLAEIVVGQSIYLPSGVTFSSVGNTASTFPTINGSYQNVGIQLDVTPFIGDNNLVEMILEPQNTAIDTSSQGQEIAGGGVFTSAIFAPNINKTSANTVVVTPDGQTVVIGGLIENNKSTTDTQVPVLGDIPVLGDLFKHHQASKEKQELVIFLTPHVIDAPERLVSVSTSEKIQNNTFMTNSFSEQELNQFLEKVPAKKNP